VVRAFFDQARSDCFEIIYIFTPQVSPLEMATFICRELDEDDPPSVFAAVPRLQWKLLEIFESGKTVVLMIDEAQLLPPGDPGVPAPLEQFRDRPGKLIQTVLVGQPELDNTLARRDMRQVNQRVALRARLAPLGPTESIEYIEHRLLASGADDLTQILSPSAAWRIADAACGIPRAINILADNVLIAGLAAGQQTGRRLARREHDPRIHRQIRRDEPGPAAPRLWRRRGRQLGRAPRYDAASAAAAGFAR